MVTKLQIAGKLKFYSKPYGRQWKWRYQVHGNMVNPKVKIPKGMENVKIIDPLNPETFESNEEKPKWIPPRRHPLLESFFKPLTLKDHPNYNLTPIKLVDHSVKFHAGIDQVCLLTKSKPIKGLPESFTSLTKNFDLKDHDELIKNYIRQALAFNPTKVECPGFVIPNEPKFNIRNEFATPHNQQMQIIMNNMIKLSLITIAQKTPNVLNTRFVLDNSPFDVIFNRGDETIKIRRNDDFAIMNKNRLKPIANEKEVNETENYKFIDMYPIFPTIDLKEEHIYNLKEPLIERFKNEHLSNSNFLDTIIHINDDNLTNEQDTARLIMFAFGNAYAQSKILERNKKLNLDSNRLKEPIVVKAVSISHEKLNSVIFQLNTLDLSNNDGIKNLVYYDNSNNELYLNRLTRDTLPYATHKNIQRMALRHLNYNPIAYEKFLSILTYDN